MIRITRIFNPPPPKKIGGELLIEASALCYR